MAARRGKTQARRSGGGNGLPGWAWLVMGVLATLLVVLLAPKLMHREGAGGFFSLGGPRADPDAQPKGSSETDGAFEPVAATRDDAKSSAKAPAKEGGYDFYELLPGEEVAMTDAQLAAIAREEARRKAAEAEAARQAAAGQDPAQQAAEAQARASAAAGLPQPLPDTPATSTAPGTPKPSAPVAGAAPARTPAPAAASMERSAAETTTGTPYVLQAGAFQASGDAEALKAKIALIGLNARVESARINGKTLYRVRMGPYATATELSAAKGKLSGGGLSAIAIKAK